MAKSRKRLGQDLKANDKLLLERPEVRLLRDVTKEQNLRRKPKGVYWLALDEKAKSEFVIYIGENEKMDCTYRPSLWDKLKTYLDEQYAKAQSKKVTKRIAKAISS